MAQSRNELIKEIQWIQNKIYGSCGDTASYNMNTNEELKKIYNQTILVYKNFKNKQTK